MLNETKIVKNSPNQTRYIITGFIILLFLMGGMISIILEQLNMMQGHLDNVTMQQNKKLAYLHGLKESIRKRQIGLRDMMVVADPFEKDEYRLLFREYAQEAVGYRDAILTMYQSEKEKQLMTTLTEAMNVAYYLQEDLAEKSIFADDVSNLSENLRQTFSAQSIVTQQLNKMMSIVQQESDTAVSSAHKTYDASYNKIVFFGLVVLLLGVIIAAYVGRSSYTQSRKLNLYMTELFNSRNMLEQRVEERTKELVAAKIEAESSDRAKSEFLSRVSHELRTPLNAVLGFAQIINLDLQKSKHGDQIEEIIKAGNHLLELINDVLDLASIESGEVNINTAKVSINSIINECCNLMQPMVKKFNVVLKDEITEQTDHLVMVDYIRYKQVLLNLISNAIKYNKNNGAVTLKVEERGNGLLRISVHDTGLGIAEEYISQLFEPFTRFGERQHIIEGTGIGLAICKRFVDAMGGKIGLESTSGVGSVFWVDVLLAEAKDNRSLAS